MKPFAGSARDRKVSGLKLQRGTSNSRKSFEGSKGGEQLLRKTGNLANEYF